MKEHVDPKDATDHEITPLTFLAACRHLNEATLGSCPNIFPSDALVIIREPGFLYSRSQRVLGPSRLWQVKRSKPLVFNSHIPLSTLHGRQTEMGGYGYLSCPFIRTESLGSRKRNLYNYTKIFHLPWVKVKFLY